MQLRQNRRHYMGLIDGSVRREGTELILEFQAAKSPAATYAYRARALPEPDEPRDPDGVAGALFADWMEKVEADDVVLPAPSGQAVTWLDE